ncbi:MAG: hypothetical protein K0Q79_2972 [Flavipsychrobacter sp.]|jgi:hypothetical protein|nr:hypothetical protein [Flavipsychrobacter sp.]
MANENEYTKPEGSESNEPKKHESWLKHIVDEIKEEIEELTEEAQQMDPNDFSAIGDGQIHHVHNHRHDNDKKEDDTEKK